MTIVALLPRLLVVVLVGCLLAAIARLAWISDDAYITLRSVENLLAGHGPVWNVGERVQTFTHPLWFGLLAGGRWLAGEHYFTTLALSAVCSMGAVALLLRTAGNAAAATAVLLLLLGSRAFGDFATSGLETPLVMLLLVWLARLDERTAPGSARPFAIAFVLGLCGCTRLDLLLLGAPVLLAHLRRDRPLQQAALLGLALAPLVGWSLFATWYYGSPFPITAFAKAFAPGVPAMDLLAQGWRYVVHTARHDAVTLLVVGGGAVLGLAMGALRGRMLAVGVVLGCAYVTRVGGDFMAGRFFVPAFALALAVLARWLAKAPRTHAWAVAGFAAGLMWLPGTPPFLRAVGEDLVPAAVEHGIQDERRFYFAKFGLCSPQREIPQPGRFTTALRRQGRNERVVLGSGMAGGIPFVAGELFHFVDPWLCDPLLMRLPVVDPRHWRIGHFTRGLPDGYAESIAFDDNRIVHPGLRRYYATLRTVLRADLASPSRWQALATLLSGDEDALRKAYVGGAYRAPDRASALLDDLRAPRPAGAFWFDDAKVLCIHRGGLRLRALHKGTASALHLWVSPLSIYRLRFLDGTREVGTAECLALVDPGLPPAGDAGDMLGYLRRFVGLQRFPVALPAAMPAFDTVLIDAQHEPWMQPALGGVDITP